MLDEVRPFFRGRKMANSTQDKDKMKTATLEGFRPFVNYRNREDDPVMRALENAAKQLKAEGKPLIRKSRSTLCASVFGAELLAKFVAVLYRRKCLRLDL
jgi:hypothetical protein